MFQISPNTPRMAGVSDMHGIPGICDALIPLLNEIIEEQEGEGGVSSGSSSGNSRRFWMTTHGVIGITHAIDAMELESTSDAIAARSNQFESLAGRLPSGITMKVLSEWRVLKGEEANQGVKHYRSDVLAALGAHIRREYVSFEMEAVAPWKIFLRMLGRREPVQNEIRTLSEMVPGALIDRGFLNARCLSRQELVKHFAAFGRRQWILPDFGIQIGAGFVGVVRVWKPASGAIRLDTLTAKRSKITGNHDVTVNIRRWNRARAESFLRRTIRLHEEGARFTDATRREEAETAFQEVTAGDKSLFDVELLITVYADTEAELLRELRVTEFEFRSLGETVIETVGRVPSYTATRLGGRMHQSYFVRQEAIRALSPIYTDGIGRTEKVTAPHVLAVYREDYSVEFLDIYHRAYEAFNWIIIGGTGSGKSLFGSLMTSSILQNPNIELIKIDVGGSGSRECRRLGGREHKITLGSPAGVDPFVFVGEEARCGKSVSEEKIQVLASFISGLILERDEYALSSEMRAGIEACLKGYLDGKPEKASLNDFFKNSSSVIPRRALLSRWCEGGVFGKVVAQAGEDAGSGSEEGFGLSGAFSNDCRFRYFNFDSIFNTQETEFARGGMSAVMAYINMCVLTRGHERRFRIECDEVPFFIRTNWEFFESLNANIRKLGHSMALTSQLSSQLIGPRGEDSLFRNSHIKMLFSMDGSPEEFQGRTGISDRGLRWLLDKKVREQESNKEGTVEGRSLSSELYREALLLDSLGERVIKIKVTSGEYWRLTSSQSDRERIEQVLKAVPGLTEMEAIRCLAVARKKAVGE